ncbi:MAG: hypothetical protein ISS28_06975 [Candidatus Cloacimonetes bacterium]|nr:hypothetical protein [Candidatus Cloacimonadota bacterium]
MRKKILKMIIVGLVVLNLAFITLNLFADSSGNYLVIPGKKHYFGAMLICQCPYSPCTCYCLVSTEILKDSSNIY